MRHALSLRNSYILRKDVISLYTVVLVHFFLWFVGAYDTSLGLILPRNPCNFFAVREIGCPSRGNLLDLCFFPFPFISNLDCGQEVTTIFIG